MDTLPLAQDPYRVRLPVFEGPLDLLLHLIRKEQLNIYDIPIAEICKSYFESLEVMCQPDVNVAGEFFVMAATLLQLKSQMLLPPEGSDQPEEDPRLPLVAQLLEYERFKKASEQLDARPWLYRDNYPRPATLAEFPDEAIADGPSEPIDTFQLLLCLKIALDRTNRPPLQIAMDEASLRDKVTAVTEVLDHNEIVPFSTVTGTLPKRTEIVLSFLAILELARLKFIEIIQYENFGPIQIRSLRSLKQLNMALLEQF